ncbi:MAG: thiamine phosphate synthase [Candidatus Krumholzibacteriia bacterium]
MKKKVGHLHVITDETVQERFTHAQLAELAIAGGADLIQFRDKARGARELLAAAGEVGRVCRAAGVPLVVNDRADIALAVGADGVHLGSTDLPIAAARRLLGPHAIIGGTAADLQGARQAQRDGADYVGFGHVYPTHSKEKPGAAIGTGPLREVCRELGIPVVAIGGIDGRNAGAVLDGGVWGIAVISAVCEADDPERAAAGLAKLVRARYR